QRQPVEDVSQLPVAVPERLGERLNGVAGYDLHSVVEVVGGEIEAEPPRPQRETALGIDQASIQVVLASRLRASVPRDHPVTGEGLDVRRVATGGGGLRTDIGYPPGHDLG